MILRFSRFATVLFVQVLMEATPTFLDYTEIMEVFMQVDGVVRVHNLRLWSLSVNKNALSAHLAIGNYVGDVLPLSKIRCCTHFHSLHTINTNAT